ncbi:uncharacterized protein LOC133718029 [Rosa rugosa]|uniref:uncharacterized protein LOC133718029 n=1 Tax=Rosa rugosa TaxID=74645 RepID=UPI002B40D303|nr:uncharacterized protein LOC133718029 [Rosa rugosa]
MHYSWSRYSLAASIWTIWLWLTMIKNALEANSEFTDVTVPCSSVGIVGKRCCVLTCIDVTYSQGYTNNSLDQIALADLVDMRCRTSDTTGFCYKQSSGNRGAHLYTGIGSTHYYLDSFPPGHQGSDSIRSAHTTVHYYSPCPVGTSRDGDIPEGVIFKVTSFEQLKQPSFNSKSFVTYIQPVPFAVFALTKRELEYQPRKDGKVWISHRVKLTLARSLHLSLISCFWVHWDCLQY